MYENILVITDNEFLYEQFKNILVNKGFESKNIEFAYSYSNKQLCNKYSNIHEFIPVNLKGNSKDIIIKYDLVISLHCKQLFPKKMVESIDCINIHPGFNPYNRGWFPQVFSILNNMPCGVTIHLMDEELDHGGIIVQEQVEINEWDTSETIYNKLMELEVRLISENIEDILNKDYTVKPVTFEGNVNLKQDFEKLCEIDLNKVCTAKEFINNLRALSFSKYNNAYFITEDGKKVWVDIKLTLDE